MRKGTIPDAPPSSGAILKRFVRRPQGRFSPLSQGVAREREGNPSGGVTWWVSL